MQKISKTNEKKTTGVLLSGQLILSVNACKKVDNNHATQPSKVAPKYRTSEVNFRNIDIVPTDLINSENFLDEADEKIRCGQYELTRAFAESVTPTEMAGIFERLNEANDHELLYSDVFEIFPTLKDRIESKILSGANYELPYDFTSFDEIQEALVRKGYTYSSSLYLVNNDDNGIVSFDTSNILVSTALEYGDDDEIYSDDYHVFHIHDGVIRNIRMSEEEALNTIFPLISTSQKTRSFPTATGDDSPSPKTTTPAWLSPNLHFRFNQFKGYDRCELDKHSEVYVCGKSAVHSGSNVYIKNLWGNLTNYVFTNESRELAIIHKDDFNGSVRNLNGLNAWIYDWIPSDIMMEHYVSVIQVFERDWVVSKKPLGYIKESSTSSLSNSDDEHIIWGHCTYASDFWYAEPQQNDGRMGIAIDDSKKDYIYSHNGQWQGVGGNAVFMQIQN